MTNGQKYALQIIVADKLGIDVGFVSYAKDLYENDIDIPDCFGGLFVSEANDAVAKIVNAGLKDKANELFNKYKRNKMKTIRDLMNCKFCSKFEKCPNNDLWMCCDFAFNEKIQPIWEKFVNEIFKEDENS